jgi:hypothetical protein
VVTNGTRALVMVLDERSDAGEHAIDLEQAFVIVEHLINHGRLPIGVDWHVEGQNRTRASRHSGCRIKRSARRIPLDLGQGAVVTGLGERTLQHRAKPSQPSEHRQQRLDAGRQDRIHGALYLDAHHRVVR